MKYISLVGAVFAILVAFAWSQRRAKRELAENDAMRQHLIREYSEAQ